MRANIALLITASIGLVTVADAEGQIPLAAPQWYLEPSTSANYKKEQQGLCNPRELNIHREEKTENNDVAVWLTFKYPPARSCWLEFIAPPPRTSGKPMDVIVTRQPKVADCPKKRSDPGQEIGRLRIPVGGGEAKWLPDYSVGDFLNKPGVSKCPTSLEEEGIRLVSATFDADLTWKQEANTGVRLVYRH